MTDCTDVLIVTVYGVKMVMMMMMQPHDRLY